MRPSPFSPASFQAPSRTLVVDETLRDGLQSASAENPPIADKRALLHAMAAIGVDVVSIGLPAASPAAVDDAAALLREIVDRKLPLIPTAAARTMPSDVSAIAEVSQRGGAPVEVYAFIGSSPIRHYTEGWSDSFLVDHIVATGEAARREGLPFCLVTEDTTRAPPTTLGKMWSAALDVGATRLCLCDTVGHADPRGVFALVAYARDFLVARGASHVELDWHGHDDRGLALGNALAAAITGVQRVHGTALGIGERSGNVALEPLLYNLAEIGRRSPVALPALRHFSDTAARALGRKVGAFAPLVGDRSRELDRARATPAVLGGEVRAAPAVAVAVDDGVEERLPLTLRLNGERVHADVPASRTLLELLRYDLDHIGTRQGCDKGDCGACTVLVDGEPVLSCLTLAAQCDGREVDTVEGLRGPPELDPLLDAFDRCGAGQCGFCTPGMLMTAQALLAQQPRPTRDTIRMAISGNLCRCTGYGPIVSAIDLAAKIRAGEEPRGVGLPGAHVPPPLPPAKDRAR
ncbi:MAG: 2Fe-2S iron-sulfur cluster binding domain-containing protein [Polyangiaceae bacterium]|nr:2Fe-2S iron-sulfur cluster binding domain-containing protein [Polyangiaceae bacterium]MBK8942657.1 2Fe-2S iron-sulfur cluster binding domain-containing protein [Polyangiaceae bacterium]